MMTTSRPLKILVLFAVACLVSSCKLAVVVEEGGLVQSKSGKRNCQEGNTCTFEVTDTNFNETFTAIPLPGYKFIKWRTGPEFLCSGATIPTCTLLTTLFAGNAAIEAVIASDKIFSIKPVFKAITPPSYVVKDGKGVVLGGVTDFNYESVTVRLVHVDEKKKEHGYLLAFDNDSVVPIKSNTLLWSNSSCTGDIAYMLLPEAYHFMEPLLSNAYQVINESPQGNGVFSLARISPRDEAQLLPKPYAKYGDVCQPWGGAAKGVQATIILHDLGAKFTPPFGLFSE